MAPGFRKAPVSKALLFATLGTNVACLMSPTLTPSLVITRHSISSGQLWRLLTSPFVCTQPGEFVFSCVLIYYFRLLERQMGSRKYFVYILLSILLWGLGMTLALFSLTSTPLINGMYGPIFASMVFFVKRVPALLPFSFFGLSLSDKVFVYASAVQLLLHTSRVYFAPPLIGLAVGVTYFSLVPQLARLQLPEVLVAFGSKYIVPLLDNPSISATTPQRHNNNNNTTTTNNNNNLHANTRQNSSNVTSSASTSHPIHPSLVNNIIADSNNSTAGGQQGFTDQLIGGDLGLPGHAHQFHPFPRFRGPTARATPIANVIVQEENVVTLVQMGFERNAVVRALQQARNNVESASNLLVDGLIQ